MLERASTAFLAWFVAFVLLACGTPPHADVPGTDATDNATAEAGDAGPTDAERDVVRPPCMVDNDCSDGRFCNGAERCMPGATGADSRGCVAAADPACGAGLTCDEASARCINSCSDADGDGHRAMSCGGDDCDDSDSNRFPGNTEVCDTAGHDEDCESSTFGVRDQDRDGSPDAVCCNTGSDGMRHCGNDCDDTAASVNPRTSEVCDGLDNNCDGRIDENVQSTFYVDADGDGFGSSVTGAETRMACSAPMGFSANSNDCDDTARGRNPSAPEVCDGADNNCDGTVDEGVTRRFFHDADGDGYGDPDLSNTMSACTVPLHYVENNTDCDDTNPGRNPGAPEVCDGTDNNCNGTTDEFVDRLYWRDADGDGFGSSDPAAPTTRGCSPAMGYAPNNVDCDDTNAGRNPAAPEVCDNADNNCNGSIDEGAGRVFHADTDGDGFGDPMAATTVACSPPSGFVENSADCDDTNRARNPAATEVCDGVDNDCDGMTDEGVQSTFYEDADGDSYGSSSASAMTVRACAAPSGYATNRLDCDDTNRARNPAAPEVCDSLDNDCDGTADNGVQITYIRDADGDGFGSSDPAAMRATGCSPPSGFVGNALDCDDTTRNRSPATPEVCDGVDNNCSGAVDEGVTVPFFRDNDGDGFGDASSTTTACRAPMGYVSNNTDCDDTSAARNPGSPEVCDGLDNNCNSTVDEGVTRTFYRDADGDRYGALAMTQTACIAPAGYVDVSGDCDDTSAARNPGAPEICDGLDNNCNAMVDEGVRRTFFRDADGDLFGDPTGPTSSACSAPAGYVENNIDCDDTTRARNPAAPEVCDGVDNDCDGMVDEGVQRTFSRDADGDGFGTAVAGMTSTGCTAPAGYVENAADCDDTRAARNPAATEICDGLDNDCDGMVDEGLSRTYYRDADGDMYGNASMTQTACAAPAGYVTNSSDCDDASAARNPGAPEICDGIDNDCDAMIDEGVMQVFYRDADNDGFGNTAMPSMRACGTNTGYVQVAGDCNDSSASVNPGATEACDGLDTNCNSLLDGPGEDDDRDGVADTACGAACTGSCGDCNDARPDVRPGATEICDGLDSNCNGMLDGPGEDDDRDGRADIACAGALGTDCNDTNNTIYVGAPELCNGIDNNCDGVNGEDDDNDAHADTSSACTGGPFPKDDCNDTVATTYAGAAETCNGVDDNCNGTVDDAALTSSYCTRANTLGLCVNARCVTTCQDFFGDCDGDTTNGCETDLRADRSHCGACGNSCGAGGSCLSGVCDVPTSLGAGVLNSCMVRSGGGVACWGSGINGALGNGGTTDSNVPVTNTAVTNAVAVDMGYGFGCAMRSDGTVRCWGDNSQGTLGNGTFVSAPGGVTVTGINDAVQIALGRTHACVRRASGTVACWGANNAGQLGDGTTTPRGAPVAVSGLTDAVDLAVGGFHSCARRAAGPIVCWGGGGYGNLGNGSTSDSSVPVTVTGISGATAIIAGGSFSCAQTGGTTVICWGDGTRGQMGDGTNTSRSVPGAAVSGLSGASNIVGLAAGYDHACARRSDDTIRCWGRGNEGQIGNGMMSSINSATIANIQGALEIVSNANHNCVRRINGEIMCWGENSSGQVGTTGALISTPTQASAPIGLGEVGAGDTHSCARRLSGAVHCWGQAGRLGDGAGSDHYTPSSVSGLTDAAELDSGGAFNCVRRATGAVVCWGDNSLGQIGDGTTMARATPVTVTSLPTDIVQVATGTAHACARRAGGTVLCWGQNDQGQIGDGSNTTRTSPTLVTAFSDAVALGAGARRTCVRRATGATMCWGMGPSGSGGGSSNTPQTVSGLPDAVMFGTGGSSTIALSASGTVFGWGSNNQGSVGDGTTSDRFTPVAVIGLPSGDPVRRLFDSESGTNCSIHRSGAMFCWGENYASQIGDGTGMYRTVPTNPSGWDGRSRIAVTAALGYTHTCVRDSASRVLCWGWNSRGELGIAPGATVTNNSTVEVPTLP